MRNLHICFTIVLFQLFTLMTFSQETPNVPRIELGSGLDGGLRLPTAAERFMNEAERTDGVAPDLLREVRNLSLSVGDLINWDFDDDSKTLGIERQRSEVVAQKLENRLSDRKRNLLELQTAIALMLQPNNDELRRLKQSFAASELESELAFNDALSEVFPPREYVAFNRYLIGKSRVSVGAVRMLSDYLRLNDSQKVRFEKARTIILTTTRDTKHQSSEAEFIQAMTDAENSLDRQQLEEFNKAVGRIPGNSSLRDYYVRLSKEQQLRLCGAYTVFREIRDEIEKENQNQ